MKGLTSPHCGNILKETGSIPARTDIITNILTGPRARGFLTNLALPKTLKKSMSVYWKITTKSISYCFTEISNNLGLWFLNMFPYFISYVLTLNFLCFPFVLCLPAAFSKLRLSRLRKKAARSKWQKERKYISALKCLSSFIRIFLILPSFLTHSVPVSSPILPCAKIYYLTYRYKILFYICMYLLVAGVP